MKATQKDGKLYFKKKPMEVTTGDTTDTAPMPQDNAQNTMPMAPDMANMPNTEAGITVKISKMQDMMDQMTALMDEMKSLMG